MNCCRIVGRHPGREMQQCRPSLARWAGLTVTFKLIAPSLLVIDDFGLERLSAEQAHDFYEIVSERYERASTVLTGNRHITI